jgi:tellurium resistance protein TerZ
MYVILLALSSFESYLEFLVLIYPCLPWIKINLVITKNRNIKSIMIRPDLAGLTITIEVLQGRNLVAKDRNVMGKRSYSDPFAQLHIGGKWIGETSVIPKSLNPIWNSRFEYKMGADAATNFIQANHRNEVQSDATLMIWDHDTIGKHSTMGTVMLSLDPLQSETTKWYDVGQGVGKYFCKNATGEVQIKITYQGTKMLDVTKGQSLKLQYHRIKFGLAWDVEEQQHVDLDSSCVAVDKRGQVLIHESVYYGNLTNANLSLQHSGDETTGEAIGDDERILVELDRIPSEVLALYFILSVATPHRTFNHVKSARVRIISTETSQGICRYVPNKIGAESTSLFLCRLHRTGNSNWIFTPIEEGDAHARDFGMLIPKIKSYTLDLVPSIQIDPHDRVAILRKEGTIRVSTFSPRGKIPPLVSFGLAWDVTGGIKIDLDASAILLDQDYQLQDLVSFKQLVSNDGSIRHSGDERQGDQSGDDEIINISLVHVSEHTKYIGFVINSYSGQELDDIDKASCHLFDPTTKADIARYTLTNCKQVDKHTAMLMACLYRSDDATDWYLRIISLPLQGLVAGCNVSDLQEFLLTHPHQQDSQAEDEIVVTAMPSAVPVDDEIVVTFAEHEFRRFAAGVDEEIVL